MVKVTSADDYKLISSFESVRHVLLQDRYAERLERPLAYWALPNDRRLPLAFLGRTVRDLLATPYDELLATPGVGQKKISSLVTLLNRAALDQLPDTSAASDPLLGGAGTATSEFTNGDGSQFDPATVSEAMWAQWRQTVRSHDVGNYKLGQLAPSLQNLPTVIWHTPLSFYLDYTVDEIRRLKTHGEKRVRVVLEVFYTVHTMIFHAPQQGHLEVALVPRFARSIERWIAERMQRNVVPSGDEVRDKMARPLLNQVQIDAGDTVFKLAEGRLGIHSEPQNVRVQSRNMGVTRARVYQLLDECARVMEVRWPHGRLMLEELRARFQKLGADSEETQMFDATCELCFPHKSDAQRPSDRH